MVTAALMGGETKVPLRVIAACPGTAEMDDGGQVLLLLECHGSVANQFCHVAVKKRGRQLNRVAWDNSGIETVEPTRVEVVPRPIFDNHMVMDTVALRFLKRAVGDLEHADCRRGRLVPLEGIRGDEAPPPVGSSHGIAGALGLSQGREQFGCNSGC